MNFSAVKNWSVFLLLTYFYVKDTGAEILSCF
jgi:hypothetical protein